MQSKQEPFKLDSIVQSVIDNFATRAEFGKTKYGTDLDREDLTVDQWLEHAQQEAMDFILYITKVRKILKPMDIFIGNDEANNKIEN